MLRGTAQREIAGDFFPSETVLRRPSVIPLVFFAACEGLPEIGIPQQSSTSLSKESCATNERTVPLGTLGFLVRPLLQSSPFADEAFVRYIDYAGRCQY